MAESFFCKKKAVPLLPERLKVSRDEIKVLRPYQCGQIRKLP